MRSRGIITIICILFLGLIWGCSGQEVTAPRDEQSVSSPGRPTGSGHGIVTLESLKAAPPAGTAAAGADVAITAFKATPSIVQPGDVLTLTATVANLGTAVARGPIEVWIGVLGTDFEFQRVTLPSMAVGLAVSGSVYFDVPMDKFAKSYPPGVYTLYCTHDFIDNNPVNNYQVLDVELAEIVPRGDIAVTVTPNTFTPLWTLTGPGGFMQVGMGADSLFNVVAGDYTITWGDWEGYVTPASETRTVAADTMTTFRGIYTLPHGTVIIDPDPDEINAPWTLNGPVGFLTSGTGDTILDDMVPGVYRIIWGAVAGFEEPDTYSLYLTPGGEIKFGGLYTPLPMGNVMVDPSPDEIDAPWTLSRPDFAFEYGTGDTTFLGMPTGTYTLTWGDVVGYITPEEESLTLHSGATIIFAANYAVMSDEGLGIYFDQDATQTCADAAFLDHVPAYILYTNPTIATTRGFECGFDLSRAGGDAFNSVVTASYPLDAVDVGVSSPEEGSYNFITGFGVPLPATVITVMGTLDIFVLEMETVTMTMRAAIPSSSQNDMPMIMLDDFSLQDVQIATPTDTLAQSGECGGKSFAGVRKLFR